MMRSYRGQRALEAPEGMFDDDPIAQKILRGWLDGLKEEELLKLSGLSQTEYESKEDAIMQDLRAGARLAPNPDSLLNLADAIAEDILNTPDDELLRDVKEDFIDSEILIEQIAAGDRNAMRMFYSRHSTILYRLCFLL
jgi:hypothetical protein